MHLLFKHPDKSFSVIDPKVPYEFISIRASEQPKNCIVIFRYKNEFDNIVSLEFAVVGDCEVVACNINSALSSLVDFTD